LGVRKKVTIGDNVEFQLQSSNGLCIAQVGTPISFWSTS
jgi:hypothetical protein